METKHTKEYAKQMAINYNTAFDSDVAYAKGYMKAIEETAAPDLLEALVAVKSWAESYGMGKEYYDKVINAIKKATS